MIARQEEIPPLGDEENGDKKSSQMMLPPSMENALRYVPQTIGVPPVPFFEEKPAAVTSGIRSQLEKRGLKPKPLPETTVICCTRINALLQHPLSGTLPPGIKERWRGNIIHPKEYPLLRRAMAVTDIDFIGDITALDQKKLLQDLKEYGFEEDTIDLILELLDMITRKFGITHGIAMEETERTHFELFKNLATEEYDSARLSILLNPLTILLQKINPAKIRSIVKYKLEEIGCTLIGDFVELTPSDIDNCDLNDAYAPMIATLVEGIEKLGLKMGMRLPAKTKKALQLHKTIRIHKG